MKKQIIIHTVFAAATKDHHSTLVFNILWVVKVFLWVFFILLNKTGHIQPKGTGTNVEEIDFWRSGRVAV